MPITFSCPSCHAPGTAPDSFAGRQARCQKCKAPFTVPPPNGAPATSGATVTVGIPALAAVAATSLIIGALGGVVAGIVISKSAAGAAARQPAGHQSVQNVANPSGPGEAPPSKLDKPVAELSAAAIDHQFRSELAGDEKFKGKSVLVHGDVIESKKTGDGPLVAITTPGDPHGAVVLCYLAATPAADAVQTRKAIMVAGVCDGKKNGHVTLRRCEIVTNKTQYTLPN